MELVLIWVTLSVVVGVFSSSKGHSFFGGFVFSLLLSPVIAGLIVAIRKPNVAQQEAAALSEGDVRKCPFCAELVKREAVKCKHCGSQISPEPAPVEQ